MLEQNDVIYGLTDNGDLLWYRHDGRGDGRFRWAFDGARKKVGNEWNGFSSIFSGGDGVIYVIKGNGELLWHRHDGRNDGSFTWAEGSGKTIAHDWNGFSTVFSGGDGVIYAIEERSRDPRDGRFIGGDLLWHRHDGWRDGSPVWSDGRKKVGNRWDGLSTVFSGDDGVIYGIKVNGEVLWYRHDGRNDGSFTWAEGSGKTIAHDWNGFSTVFSGGDGVIYAIEERSRDPRDGRFIGGDLLWHRHDGWRDGSPVWSDGRKKVGNRWDGLSTVFSGGDGPYTKATQAIAQFHTDNHATLSVGSPLGPVMPLAGGFQQAYTFGSIIKPQGETPQLGDRFHVSVEIAAIRCFGTDDPGGTDEPYMITTVYALDPSRREDSVDTRRIDNGDNIGDVEAGDVFALSRQIANNITIPGDGSIRIHVQLWDEEAVGSTSNLKEATSAAAQAAIVAALTYINVPIGGGAALAAAAAGWLASVGDAIGDFVGDFVENLLGDNLIDQHDFVIPTSFLQALTSGDPSALNRTSSAIPGVTFNFPDTVEDDSWLFERGQGTYRVFFKIIRV